MTNTANTSDLTAFAKWLQGLDVQLLGEDVDVAGIVDRYVEECPAEELPSVVRHTTCRHCGFDVEVWLDQSPVIGTDRGGEKTCPSSVRLHLPYLDAEDVELHRLMTSDDED
jgi:hypothetical protein